MAAFFADYEVAAFQSDGDRLTEQYACWRLIQVLSQPIGGRFHLTVGTPEDAPPEAPEEIPGGEERSEAPLCFFDERCLTLADAADRLGQILRKKVSSSTVWRWTADGIDGERLESKKLGGRFVTSVEAIDRFATRLEESARRKREEKERPPALPKKPSRSEKRRQRQIDAAKKRLEDSGI